MTDIAKCGLCGEPMPEGEEMFKFHGYSGPCPEVAPRPDGARAFNAGSPEVKTLARVKTEQEIFDAAKALMGEAVDAGASMVILISHENESHTMFAGSQCEVMGAIQKAKLITDAQALQGMESSPN